MKRLTVAVMLLAGLLVGCSMSSAEAVEKPVRGAVIEIPEVEIDLGTIARDADEVVGEIVFFNTGDKVLNVIDVTGSCSCFSGFSGDKVVAPGDGGILEVRFDKSKIPSGQIKRSLNVVSNDKANRKVKVVFAFTVVRDPVQDELQLIKTSLAELEKEMRLVRTDLAKALKLLEAGAGAKAKAKPKPKRDTTVYDIKVGSAPFLGPKDARVTIVEFSDFQCPFCTREYPKLKQVLAKYPKDVRLVFKHYPRRINMKSLPPHAATELAKQQGGSDGFWKMHDLILAKPKKIAVADLRVYAVKLGLNMEEFDAVMANKQKMTRLVSADKAQGKKAKLTATPQVYINGKKLYGRSVKNYQKTIDAILKGTKAVKKGK